ncbi:hypothetical protein DsansV1_C08g0086951 [Dioscorea sansibarensis]
MWSLDFVKVLVYLVVFRSDVFFGLSESFRLLEDFFGSWNCFSNLMCSMNFLKVMDSCGLFGHGIVDVV